MMRRRRNGSLGLGLAAALLMALWGAASPAQAATPLTIVIFGMPSLGAFLPNVIKQQKLDQANGLDITFVERTPDAYAAQFNSGEFEVGGSASVLVIGLADTRGVKVSYLFNLFDYWGAIVTQRPGIKTVADLAGKQLAGARGTTNYTMTEWFARGKGLDLGSISVVNTATPGLIGYALADRADAVQVWEPAYSLLLAKRPDIRTLDLDIVGQWRPSPAAITAPISASARISPGSRSIATWFPGSTAPMRPRRTGSPPTLSPRRRRSSRVRTPSSARRSSSSSGTTRGSA
jgi:NitT/TauT family transport system substrate-binding protein